MFTAEMEEREDIPYENSFVELRKTDTERTSSEKLIQNVKTGTSTDFGLYMVVLELDRGQVGDYRRK